jgi:hypothetical protein
VNAEHSRVIDAMEFLQTPTELTCPCGRITVDVTDRPRRRHVPVLCTMRCMWSRRESPAHARLRERRTAKYELNAAGFSEAKAQQLRDRSYFGTGNSSDSSGTGDDCVSRSSDDDGDDAPPTPTGSGR